MDVFQFTSRQSVIQTWFCKCQQYLCLFHIVFECIQGLHDQGKMLVFPNQLLYWVLSTSDQCFVSFQPIWCHPHSQIRITLFHGVRISIPNWKPSPNRVPIELSQIAFSHNSTAKEWPYRFRSRGTTRSAMLDRDLCHLCRGRRIQMSGHSDSGIFNNLGASSFFTWVYADTASAACPAHPGSLEMTSMTFAAVICDADEPCSVNAAQDPESSFTMSPRSTTQPLIFLVLCIQFGILQMRDVHQWCEVYFSTFFSCFINHVSVSDFWFVPRRNLFKFFPFFVHCCFCCGYLHCLRQE